MIRPNMRRFWARYMAIGMGIPLLVMILIIIFGR